MIMIVMRMLSTFFFMIMGMYCMLMIMASVIMMLMEKEQSNQVNSETKN
jgi:hypothetical protein